MPDMKVDLGKCKGVGVCEQVCPMNFYDMADVKGEE